jgi:hypothetical protein
MKKLRVGIIDLVARGPARSLFMRIMGANLASVMPQAIATWCTQEGHQVAYLCYTGAGNLLQAPAATGDLVFISAFTESAQTAYALSNFCRSRGAVTVLGGPHARCYPSDALRYFDYVLGFTDRTVLQDVLRDCAPSRPAGVYLSAPEQPVTLPGARERWPFLEATLRAAPLIKVVPTVASLGCPYTCEFCIDAAVPYQPLDTGPIKEDLRFLLKKFRRPIVAWHDPNFGVRFDATLSAIEEAVPPGSIHFIAESSLSVLSEPHLRRLERNGFRAMLPGIESWYDLGNKSRTGASRGMDKVKRVAEHVNLILRHIPYVQTNFVLGLDTDSGDEPFELTRRFLDRTPGAFPGYSLLTAFGQAAPLNRQYQRDGRVLPFPFHFLNNNQAMNVRPRHYGWREFYDHVIDLTRYSFSWRAVLRRFRVNRGIVPRWMNLLRSVSSEGFGRLRYYRTLRRLLDTDRGFAAYFEQETIRLPPFFVDIVRKDLGPLWAWLPPGALDHDPTAWLEVPRSALPPPASRNGPVTRRPGLAPGTLRPLLAPLAPEAGARGWG